MFPVLYSPLTLNLKKRLIWSQLLFALLSLSCKCNVGLLYLFLIRGRRANFSLMLISWLVIHFSPLLSQGKFSSFGQGFSAFKVQLYHGFVKRAKSFCSLAKKVTQNHNRKLFGQGNQPDLQWGSIVCLNSPGKNKIENSIL